MRGSPVKYTRSTRGCAASQRRHPAGVGALPLHAQRESLDAAHRQVAFEGSQHRPDGARQRCAAYRSAASSVTTTPPSTSPCPARYLVSAVHREVRAQFQRAHDQRRRERVVHHQRRAPPRCAISAIAIDLRRPAAADSRWSPSGCSRACASATAARSASRSQISAKRTSHARGLEHVHQQADGRAVHGVGRHDGLRRSVSAREERRVERRHARSARQARHARLRARTSVLRAPQSWDCRNARSSSPSSSCAKTRSSCSIDLVEVARRGIDRSGDGNVARRVSCGRPRARLWCESSNLYFLFQRTPLLVSSRMMPCSSNSSRI